VRGYLQVHLNANPYETFGCLFLDARHRLIACEDVFRGTVDGCHVYVREVMRRCLVHNAAALILFHNHPSGQLDQSLADERVTREIQNLLAKMDVRVLDHWIVGDGLLSFAEHGLI